MPVQLSLVRPGTPKPAVTPPRMRWSEFAEQQPEFADQVRSRFQQHHQHVLATMALADSARVSGTDLYWVGADVCISADPAAPKAQDLRGDSRFALHVNPGDGTRQQGDIRIVGVVEEVRSGVEYDEFVAQSGPDRSVELFRLLVEGIEMTQRVPDGLSLTTWLPHSDLNTVIHA